MRKRARGVLPQDLTTVREKNKQPAAKYGNGLTPREQVASLAAEMLPENTALKCCRKGVRERSATNSVPEFYGTGNRLVPPEMITEREREMFCW